MTIVVTLLTLLAPLAMFPVNVALCSKHKKHVWIYCALIAMAFAALAFNFTPFSWQNTDILRHIRNMEHANAITIADINDSRVFESLPIYYLLLKFFSFLKDPQLLPAFSAFLGYFLSFYIIFKMDDSDDINITFLTLFCFLSVTSFLGFASGIRQYLSFAIFVFAFYQESIRNKWKKLVWIIYILLTGLHTTAVILIVLRILAELYFKIQNKYFLTIGILVWTVFQHPVVEILNNLFAGDPLVDKIVELTGHYSEHGSSFIVPDYVWRMIFLIISTIAVGVLIKLHKENDIVTEKYLYMTLATILFTYGGFASYDIFARFTTFAFMLVIPLIPNYIKKMPEASRGIFIFGVFVFSLLVLIYSISGYLTFHYNSVFDIVFTNIFTFIKAV